METVQKIEFRQSRDFGQLINATFSFISQNVKSFGQSLFFIAGPFLLVSILYGLYYQGTVVEPAAILDFNSGFFLHILLSFLLQMLTSAMMVIVPVEYILLYMEKGKDGFSVNEVWQASSKDIINIFLTNFGLFLIIGFGFMLLFIPGVYLAVIFSLVVIIRVIEKNSFTEALGRSSRLISGYWWFTFGLLIVIFFIVIVITVVLNFPTYIYVFVKTFHDADPMALARPGWIMTLTSLWGGLTYFLYSLIVVTLVFHYYNLVEKKEAAGLFEKVEGLDATDEV